MLLDYNEGCIKAKLKMEGLFEFPYLRVVLTISTVFMNKLYHTFIVLEAYILWNGVV